MASDREREQRRDQLTRQVLGAMRNRDFRSAMRYRADDGTRPMVVVVADDPLRQVFAMMGSRRAANVVIADHEGVRVMTLRRDPSAAEDRHAGRRVDLGDLDADMTIGLLAELGKSQGGHLAFELDIDEEGHQDTVRIPGVSELLSLV